MDPIEHVDPITATHGHVAGRLQHSFTTAGLFDRGALYGLRLDIWVDRKAKGRPDRRVVIDKTGIDGFSGRVLDLDEKRRREIAQATAGLVDSTTLVIEFPRRAVGRKATFYRWALEVTSACKPAFDYAICGGPKADRVPDSGAIRHRLKRR